MEKKIITITMMCAILLSLTGCASTKLNVKEEHITVEYGKEISLKAEDYLSNDEDVLSKVEVVSDIVNEEGKDYPAIGDYNLKFKYEKQEARIKVSVVDTTNPVFVDFKDTVETHQNNKVDFEAIYTAEDFSDATISYDDSKVNYATVGTYEAFVTATDDYGNTETKEVSVHVIAVTVQLDKTSASIYKGETAQLTTTTNVPEEKIVFSSSDTSIATVDENGLVTGVKAGKTVIIAEVNSVKAECEITVNEKTTQNTSTKPSTNTGKTNNSSSNGTSNNSASNSNQSTTADDNIIRVYSGTTVIAYAIEDTYVYLTTDTNEDNICGTLLKGQGVEALGRASSEDDFYYGYDKAKDDFYQKYDKNGEWYRVEFGKYHGEIGYIPAKYITESGNGRIVETEIIPHTVKEALELINTERIKLGIKPLVWDSTCEEVALMRGTQIAGVAQPTHNGFDEWREADWDNRMRFGECIAWGYTTAERVVLEGWKNSRAHWASLMDPEDSKIAIVRVRNNWVAVFS